MPEARPDGLLSVDELSTYTRLNRETITRLASAGAIPSFRFGRQYRFDLDSVLDACRAIEASATGEAGDE